MNVVVVELVFCLFLFVCWEGRGEGGGGKRKKNLKSLVVVLFVEVSS